MNPSIAWRFPRCRGALRLGFLRLAASRAAGLAGLGLWLLAAREVKGEAGNYQTDVRPVLEKRCYSCHGRLKQKGDLRLDAGALILKGGKNGPAVAPGDAEGSLLLSRIRSEDEEHRMPPEGKALTSLEIAAIKSWVEKGAEVPAGEQAPSSPADHWSFQPVKRPPAPRVQDEAWGRTEADLFLLAAMEKRGLRPGPGGAPGQLLRRAFLDLIGLPPTLEEQDRFGAEVARVGLHAALDETVDRLLARPQYGERWARHWLDLVRYADSNGYERDAAKPFVWRYRDWVIEALNQDKPYDRFVIEQIAGDEMPGADARSVIATGMLRLGHWDDEPADPATDRYDQLDDIVSTTGQVFLGLTVGCARCHDHKFEPISAKDYYSLIAVFNPLKRPQNGRTELTAPAGTEAERARLAERDRRLAALGKDASETERAAIRAEVPDLPQAYVWMEPGGRPPETRVLSRGNPARPGEEVEPGIPSVLDRGEHAWPGPGEKTTRRRLGLAQWIVSRENPLTARVIVNRVWQQHFGAGLVRTASDFGLMGEPPSHPELLDWLADWFMNEGGWSLKKLHRLILTSQGWRLGRQPASVENPGAAKIAGEDEWLTHLPYRRLEAEAIRDSILAVSGQLNATMFGPAVFPPIPDAAIEANTDKHAVWKASSEGDASRRTVYAFIKRGLVIPMLEVLDFCDTVNSAPRRQVTTVAPQALTLFNGEFVNQQARHFAARLRREAGGGRSEQVELAFRLALCRKPAETEKRALLAFMDEFGSFAEGAETGALEQICRVLFNLNEFAYPD